MWITMDEHVIIGKQYGNWLVLKGEEKIEGKHGKYCLCECQCDKKNKKDGFKLQSS